MMSLWERMWCWWQGVCPKHLKKKECDMHSSFCTDCLAERKTAFEAKLVKIKAKTLASKKK